jgi:hypothetical protein
MPKTERIVNAQLRKDTSTHASKRTRRTQDEDREALVSTGEKLCVPTAAPKYCKECLEEILRSVHEEGGKLTQVDAVSHLKVRVDAERKALCSLTWR